MPRPTSTVPTDPAALSDAELSELSARFETAPAAEIVAVSHAWTITLILLSLRRDPHWRLLSRDLSNTGISTVVRVEA